MARFLLVPPPRPLPSHTLPAVTLSPLKTQCESHQVCHHAVAPMCHPYTPPSSPSTAWQTLRRFTRRMHCKSLTSKLSHTALNPSPLRSETKMFCSGLLRCVTVNLRRGFWHQRHMPPFATSRIKNCTTSREQRRLGQARSTRKTQRGTSSP